MQIFGIYSKGDCWSYGLINLQKPTIDRFILLSISVFVSLSYYGFIIKNNIQNYPIWCVQILLLINKLKKKNRYEWVGIRISKWKMKTVKWNFPVLKSQTRMHNIFYYSCSGDVHFPNVYWVHPLKTGGQYSELGPISAKLEPKDT